MVLTHFNRLFATNWRYYLPKNGFLLAANKTNRSIDGVRSNSHYRQHNNYNYNNAFCRFGAEVGGGTLLSLALFQKSKEKDEEKSDEVPLLLIREADLYFESNLIDNAYNILRR